MSNTHDKIWSRSVLLDLKRLEKRGYVTLFRIVAFYRLRVSTLVQWLGVKENEPKYKPRENTGRTSSSSAVRVRVQWEHEPTESSSPLAYLTQAYRYGMSEAVAERGTSRVSLNLNNNKWKLMALSILYYTRKIAVVDRLDRRWEASKRGLANALLDDRVSFFLTTYIRLFVR